MHSVRIPCIQSPTIPNELVDLFRDVIELCKKQGCTAVDLKVQPSWEGSFYGQIQCQWTSGRHGEPSRTAVTTQLMTHIEV